MKSSSIPKIPGMFSNNMQIGKTSHHRSQRLEQEFSGKDVLNRPPTLPNDRNEMSFTSKDTSKDTLNHKVEPVGMKSSKYYMPRGQPAWIAKDRQVLRYYGYFMEHVDEKGVKLERVRKVLLLFYLSDASLYIYEPKVENSGLAQGTFLKRSVIKKSNGCLYCPEDFQVGGKIELVGHVFHLVDADKATREYYENVLETRLPSAYSYPNDPSKLEEIYRYKMKENQVETKFEPSMDFSRARKREITKKYHEHGSSLLKFTCIWDDPHPLYSERREFSLHYYLSDDTIEIRELKKPNSGRDRNSLLLSRCRLPKENYSTGNNSLQGSHPSHVSLLDLRCGRSIRVFGKIFELLDCDDFTRDFYLEKHGITQERMVREIPCKSIIANDNFDETGFFGKMLASKVPSKSFDPSLDKKILRYRVSFQKPSSTIDAKRQFILSYYLQDETLSIYEPPLKNSGIIGGKYLDRGTYYFLSKFENKKSNQKKQPVQPQDLYLGSILLFEHAPHQPMQVIEVDDHTLDYFENHPEFFLLSNVEKIAEKIIFHLKKKHTGNLRVFFLQLEKEQKLKKKLQFSSFDQFLEEYGILPILQPQERISLKRKFTILTTTITTTATFGEKSGEGGGGSLDHFEVGHNNKKTSTRNTRNAEGGGGGSFDHFEFGHSKTSTPISTPRSTERGVFDYAEFCDLLSRMDFKFFPDQNEEKNKSSMTYYLGKLRCKDLSFRKIMKRMDQDHNETISLEDFLKMLEFYQVRLRNKEAHEVFESFKKTCVKDVINIHELCDAIYPCEFSFNKNNYIHKKQEESFSTTSSNNNNNRLLYDKRSSSRSHQLEIPGTPSRSHQLEGWQEIPCTPSFRSGGSPCSSSSSSRKSFLPDEFSKKNFNHQKTLTLTDYQKDHEYGKTDCDRSIDGNESTSFFDSVSTVNKQVDKPPSRHGLDRGVIELMNKRFGHCKYQLRRSLRDHDTKKNGILDEDSFMDALLSIDNTLGEDDKYILAECFFPNTGTTIDYKSVLDGVFKTL